MMKKEYVTNPNEFGEVWEEYSQEFYDNESYLDDYIAEHYPKEYKGDRSTGSSLPVLRRQTKQRRWMKMMKKEFVTNPNEFGEVWEEDSQEFYDDESYLDDYIAEHYPEEYKGGVQHEA